MKVRWLLLGLVPCSLRAQADSLSHGDVSVERSGGFSWFSPGGSLGAVTNRRVYAVGIRRTTVVGSARRWAFSFSAELVPLMIIERTAPSGLRCFAELPNGTFLCHRDQSDRIAAGFGGTPLGGRLYWNRAGRWRAHLGGGLGALVFTSDVPVDESRHFNFTFDYGGGVEIPTARDRALCIGYKFQHISNAGMAERNPGLDANVIYVGVTRRLERR